LAVRARQAGDARARVQSASGTWLLVRGTALGGRTAVVIEPAGSHEPAALAADGYDLTPRERAIAQLVAGGLPTDAIARRLHLSPWTVQDHLKSIFAKVGVGTRGELVARLYFAHDVPALEG
jgi:DNA-binding CsgD family transcriptional regulator